jgi:NADH:ubiquinone oxidoreductase subunit 5 (subunit L)/multisubunit Na+/H+ antiporter MnhA subunit
VFSTRYLQDDPRLGRFLGVLALTTAGTVVFAAAASLGVLLAGWLVAGAGFCALLAHGRGVAGGRTALRRTAATFALGDVALLAGAAVAWAAVGQPRPPRSRRPGRGAGRCERGRGGRRARRHRRAGPLRAGAAAPLAARDGRRADPGLRAAARRGRQRGRDPARQARAGHGLAGAASLLLFAAGAVTVAYAGAVMLTRADVKGALAHSTMAQMGFMLVQIALGAVAAAVVHLVGHAMYKAALFLGSGSAITSRRRRAAAPEGRRLPVGVRVGAALVLPLAALAAAVAVAGGPEAVGGAGAAVLLAFAWASGAQAWTAGCAAARPPRSSPQRPGRRSGLPPTSASSPGPRRT